jgi:hypothetical protein
LYDDLALLPGLSASLQGTRLIHGSFQHVIRLSGVKLGTSQRKLRSALAAEGKWAFNEFVTNWLGWNEPNAVMFAAMGRGGARARGG